MYPLAQTFYTKVYMRDGRSEKAERHAAVTDAVDRSSVTARHRTESKIRWWGLCVNPEFKCSSLHARRAVLHDLDAALPGRLRRGRSARPPPPLASRAHRGLRPHRRPLYASAARAFISPIEFRRPPSSRRGEALWERVAAGSGSLWAASSVTL